MVLTAESRVVIVGGTSGIGLAVARAALGRGARVVIGSRTSDSVDRALAELDGASGRRVDVTDPDSLDAFFATTGDFDHLVYTAGDDLVRALIQDYSPKLAGEFFDVRVYRAFDTVRAALPRLSSTGSIILTSGAAAYRGGPGRLLASAAGGALITGGRSLALELAPIRVNVVAPGMLRTPLFDGMTQEAQDALFAQAGAETLLGRVAEVDEVAATYLHLMEVGSITGSVALVDSGRSIA